MDNRVFCTVQVKYIHIAKFLFHGAYYKGQGIAEVGLSLMCLVYYFVGWRTNIGWLDIIMLIFGLFFTVIYPIYLLLKAAMMMYGSRKNKSATEYVFSDKGVKMSQDREEANMDIAWKDIFFMHETKSMIFLYMTPKIGMMLPKNQLNNDEERVKDAIRNNMDPKRCKFLKQK